MSLIAEPTSTQLMFTANCYKSTSTPLTVEPFPSSIPCFSMAPQPTGRPGKAPDAGGGQKRRYEEASHDSEQDEVEDALDVASAHVPELGKRKVKPTPWKVAQAEEDEAKKQRTRRKAEKANVKSRKGIQKQFKSHRSSQHQDEPLHDGPEDDESDAQDVEKPQRAKPSKQAHVASQPSSIHEVVRLQRELAEQKGQ
jgi:hypothetical protein